jgi:metacaspase-1
MAKGIALTIGLDAVDPKHYGGWAGKLQACEADAKDMAEIATARNFSVKTLLTKAATRDAVRKSIIDVAAKAVPGDIFMLSYSGHGGQVPDRDGDELDNEDETWCLYDGELLDDELYELWGKFKPGVRILVFSDSCHSGTVVRMAKAIADLEGACSMPVFRAANRGVSYRFMPLEVARSTYRRNREFYDKLQDSLPKKSEIDVKCTVRLISGCQDNQLSQDGTFNGLFTARLLQVWNNGSFRGNYSQFHGEILRRMPPDQSPNHYVIGVPNLAYDAQEPFTL